MSRKHLLSGDPGTKNFGVAHYRKSRKRDSWECLGTRILENPINSLLEANYITQVKAFEKEWSGLFDCASSPGILIVERFMSRMHRNNASELVNIMLGILTAMARQRSWKIQLVTPAIWKNQFNRTFEPRWNVKDLYKTVDTTPHQVDAALMGRYAVDKYRNFRPSKRWIHRVESAWS